MDWTTFLSNAIASLAWPFVLLAVVLLLRRELATLLGALSRVKWGDFEAEFHSEIKELYAAAERLPPVESEQSSTKQSLAHARGAELGTVLELARISPPNALLASWIKVEEAIAQAVTRLKISADPPWEASPLKRIQLLQQWTNLDATTTSVLHRLRELRNRVAHAGSEAVSLSPTEAMEYHEAATRAIAALHHAQYVPR